MMLDYRSARTLESLSLAYELKYLGLSRPSDDVVVALCVNRTSGDDPVQEAIRRNAFQRAAVTLAREIGEIIAGQVGEHGVVFLTAAKGSTAQRRHRQRELMDRASELARRKFGLSLHFGAPNVTMRAPLAVSYQAALAAAESALASQSRLVMADKMQSPRRDLLQRLRNQLAVDVEQHPAELRARFERYMEVTGVECRYRLDVMRAHLDFGFERLTDPLRRREILEAKSFDALLERLTRYAGDAATAPALFDAYRVAVADVSDAVRRPAPARRARSLRAAREYIERHFAEDIGLRQVARVAGFTPTHFSTLFKQRERVSFTQYLIGLRLERAKQLLLNTELDLVRVAELTGFKTSPYLCRVFQREHGSSPGTFRKRAAGLRNQVRAAGLRNHIKKSVSRN
jgi:AraC-like DNA-binding protein